MANKTPIGRQALPQNHDSPLQARTGTWLRRGNSGVAVKPFGYWKDPLFLVSCSLYALNRWGLKPRVHSPFLHSHFNDLLLIPCALPLLLLLQSRLKLRPAGQRPAGGEIALYLSVWSILFELIGPHLFPKAVGDPRDVAAYVAGGLFSGLWWHRSAVLRRLRMGHEL